MCTRCVASTDRHDTFQASKKRKKGSDEAAEDSAAAAAAVAVQAPAVLKAESYTPPDPGPYPQDKPPENSVRFTPVQVRVQGPEPFLLHMHDFCRKTSVKQTTNKHQHTCCGRLKPILSSEIGKRPPEPSSPLHQPQLPSVCELCSGSW